MCGIVGYIGSKDSAEILLDGLKRLEYRGYDSAGMAALNGGGLQVVKRVGKLQALEGALKTMPCQGNVGIAHTRWATHGVPSEANAHPHLDALNEIALVHNGIIENFAALRARLEAQGVSFRSETDTETLVHLIRSHASANRTLVEAVRDALREVRGAYAIAVIDKREPDVLVAARQGSPLIIGLGADECYLASDVPAILKYTRNVLYLEDGQIAELRRDAVRITDLEGTVQRIEPRNIDWDIAAAEKEGYPHFMLKEIFQQPQVLGNLVRARVNEERQTVQFEELRIDEAVLRRCQKIHIVACGTAWHAGLVGKYLIEKFARVPVEVDVASEFRYRAPLIATDDIVMPISQSGETADTLEAVTIARAHHAKVVSIVNVVGSSIDRRSDGVIYTHTGPEIGVASTKAYTAQLMALALFSIHLGRLRETLSAQAAADAVEQLRGIPGKVQWCLDHSKAIEECARNFKYIVAHSALYIGRTYNFPTAFEGALKLKEISYIHAEGYPAGEMKHGPIALVTDSVPSICIAVQGDVYEKMVSNMQEIRARRGIVLAIATEGDQGIQNYCDHVVYIPRCYEPFSPIVAAVPVQLFAYYIAVNRGCDVDQPRNLAKSVTVE